MHVCGRGVLAAALLLAAGAPARVAGRQPPRDCATPPLTRARVQACLADAADLTAHRDSAAVLRLLEPMLGAASIDGDLLPEAHYHVAMAYFRLTKYPLAIDHFERALDGERAAHDRRAEARTLRQFAQLRKSQGAYADGLALCDQALAIDGALGDVRETALTRVVVGAIRDSMGDHPRALESFRQAMPVLGDEQSPEGANLLNEIAITEKNLGNYDEALRFYHRCLDTLVKIKNTAGQVFPLLNLGVLYATVGEEERGLAYTLEALDLARRIGDRRAENILLLNSADTYALLGQTQRALDALQQALALARELGGRSEEGETLKTLGDLNVSMGRLSAARRFYDEALRVQREIGEPRTQASTLVALADLAVRERHADDALGFAREASSLATASGRPELEWTAHRAVADAEAAGGRPADAIDELRAAARIINDLRANVTTDTSKIAFVDRRQAVFEKLATLLVASGRADEGLEAAEAGRARAFADLLAQRQIAGKPGDRTALEAVRQAQQDLRASSTRDAKAARDASGESIAVKRGETLDAHLGALREENRELASLLTAESPAATQIAATATRLDATIVEYLVTDRELLAWVIDPAGAIHAARTPVTRGRLESLTKTLRTTMDAAGDTGFAHPEAVRRPLRDLQRLLIAPIVRWLPRSPGASLVLIPQGPLALVPFAALEDEAGRPLIQRYTLAIAPAASVYEHTHDKLRAAAGTARRVLIVADPAPPANVSRLPWAREEGKLIASRFADTPVRLLVGGDATEAAVKREAGQYSLLHFATHGLVAPDRPLASSLLLASGAGEDGYLRVDEIFNMDLHAELVVLSGCSTGLGRLTGDGIIGLTRAFLYAGTPTVVVSQWDVSDRATAYLMERFYGALARGRPKAAALRAAELDTRRRYPHPALWAAFALVGEPR